MIQGSPFRSSPEQLEVARVLVWGVYGLAFLMAFFPVLEAILGTWPMRVGEVGWRYGFTGLFSRSFVTPLLGAFLALAAAIMSQHRAFARVLALAFLIWAGLGIPLLGMFLLDGIQTYGEMPSEANAPFIVSTLLAVARYGVGMLTSLALGLGGLRLLKGDEAGASRRRKGSASLLKTPGPAVKKDDGAEANGS